MNLSLEENRILKGYTDAPDIVDPATMRTLRDAAISRDESHREEIEELILQKRYADAYGKRYRYAMDMLRQSAEIGESNCVLPSVTEPNYDPLTRGHIKKERQYDILTGMRFSLRGKRAVDFVVADLLVSQCVANVCLCHVARQGDGDYSWWMVIGLR